MSKLKVFWKNFGRREFSQFPFLESRKAEIKDDAINLYVNHPKNIWNDMEWRFLDILKMTVPEWVIDPFGVNAMEVELSLQQNIIDLQNDTAAQVRFKQNHIGFCINCVLANQYRELWEKTEIFVVAFPTSYLVKCACRVILLLTKQRNRLDIVNRCDLRLSLTSLEPKVEDIAKSHQAQGSHKFVIN